MVHIDLVHSRVTGILSVFVILSECARRHGFAGSVSLDDATSLYTLAPDSIIFDIDTSEVGDAVMPTVSQIESDDDDDDALLSPFSKIMRQRRWLATHGTGVRREEQGAVLKYLALLQFSFITCRHAKSKL